MSETEINIKRFIKGDKHTFDLVYEKYAPAMFAICKRYTSCNDDAQEVLQLAFIRIYEKCSKINPDLPLAPWIKTIVIRTAINFLKERKRLQLMEDEIYFEPLPSYVPLNEREEGLKDKLLRILNEMPTGYRTIFNLFVMDNLTHKEIADYLSISEGTSKSQLAKAKNWIKTQIEIEEIHERIG